METAISKDGPLLVSFSGVDGAGKSTSIASLTDWLKSIGLEVQVVTFWDNVVVLPRLRERLTSAWFGGEKGIGAPGKPVSRRDKNLRPWYATLGRCLLYFLDAIHLRVLLEKKWKGQSGVIVFDRYIYDQLATLPIERKVIARYARFLADLVPQPDIAYLLDADPDAAFARKPEYPLAFLRQYRNCYLRLRELLGFMTLVRALPIDQMRQQVVFEFENAALRSDPQSTSWSSAEGRLQ